jgi:hypothetical protein
MRFEYKTILEGDLRSPSLERTCTIESALGWEFVSHAYTRRDNWIAVFRRPLPVADITIHPDGRVDVKRHD